MVGRHSTIHNPLGISDFYYCLVILRDELKFKGTKFERGSVSNRLNNASGKRLCLSTLLSLYQSPSETYLTLIVLGGGRGGGGGKNTTAL